MPPVIPNQDGWLAAQIAQIKRDVAALKAQQTQYVVDAAGVTRAIIGNLATDPSGNSTGLSGFGIAGNPGSTWGAGPGAIIAWRPLPYNATYFTDYGSGFQTGQYGIDAMGLVHIRGLVKSVAAYSYATPASLVIATLPTGFRPAAAEMFNVFQHDSTGNRSLERCDVLTNGQLVINGGNATGDDINTGGNSGTASYMSLRNMTFFQGN